MCAVSLLSKQDISFYSSLAFGYKTCCQHCISVDFHGLFNDAMSFLYRLYNTLVHIH